MVGCGKLQEGVSKELIPLIVDAISTAAVCDCLHARPVPCFLLQWRMATLDTLVTAHTKGAFVIAHTSRMLPDVHHAYFYA